ncbi:N-acetylmuramoyl-L-alanine amidase [Buchnera aphidicola]|uniref:N-acetylmuramoyl-L-alanine amidase n=1 Tax=Buchnera aphidicola (Macrosiphum gaurae) TaxID=2315801 RepID=A0A4D6Y9Z5_9GAMM|nr:N-acetylmuramoyl-L-alanine amidase [Buchnera aphidicola]QCI22998.1 N-acetylmuramoyl-L-alanine amidase [Buchnera aphidicola (Macrosiphum gaurae)]
MCLAKNQKNKNFKKIHYYTKNKFYNNLNTSKKITIVIDAGHGGHDPGAIGIQGLQEKKVNIEIALRLKNLLNHDSLFCTILTRNNDSYLSLTKRKQFLKNNHVNLLISIHADSSRKQYVSGASVWMVSKTRINREIDDYLKKKPAILFSKKIENIFNENKYDFFLKKTILDLQFNNFQKMELDLSQKILEQLKKNTKLNKTYPNYASLSILSSINTPSILIETGFITNFLEEKKLRTADHQNKIASSIYLGLKNYFNHSINF